MRRAKERAVSRREYAVVVACLAVAALFAAGSLVLLVVLVTR